MHSPEQEDILRSILVSSIENGFASRYSAKQIEDARRTGNLAMLLGALQDNGGTQLQQVAEKALSSVGAEVPFAFKLAPGNMSRAVIATKIDPRTGETLPYSDTQIGLIGGVAGEGKPVHPFIFDDVKFAIGAIEAQQAVNLQLE